MYGATNGTALGRKYVGISEGAQIDTINGIDVVGAQFSNEDIKELLHYTPPDELEVTFTNEHVRRREADQDYYHDQKRRNVFVDVTSLRGAELLTHMAQPGDESAI